jgi:hypothetical protein
VNAAQVPDCKAIVRNFIYKRPPILSSMLSPQLSIHCPIPIAILMSARAQKSAPASSGAIHGQCRRALIRVNMHVSYRRVLHDQSANDRHYKSRSRLRPCQKGCKTSRDLRASLKAKRVVRLSSMTSEPRLSTANGHTATIPRFLARPPSGAIQIDILRRACPELSEVSADFVRRNLTSMALKYVSPPHCPF